MRLNVVWVSIATEIVVGDENLWALLPNNRHELQRCLKQICSPEAAVSLVTWFADHPAVSVSTWFAE
jgi:hypothetical protein